MYEACLNQNIMYLLKEPGEIFGTFSYCLSTSVGFSLRSAILKEPGAIFGTFHTVCLHESILVLTVPYFS